MGDAESRRNARAVAEAEANVLRHQQRRLGDLPRFEIKITASADEFRQLINLRRDRYVEIASCLVEGIPVTPPQTTENTHHVVVLINPKAEEGVQGDDVVAVELLFREYDNYYLAFRPIMRAHRPEDPSGWYCFKDVSIPTFLKKNLRNKDNFHVLCFSSGYKNQGAVLIGDESLVVMFKLYSKFTPQNAKCGGKERHNALMSTMLFLGEGQRFPDILDLITMNMDKNIVGSLTSKLTKLTNYWSCISIRSFEHSMGITGRLNYLEEMFGFVLHVGDEYQLSLLVGPEAKVMLLMYDKTATRDLIKHRQHEARR